MKNTSDSDYELKGEYMLDYSKDVRGKYCEVAMPNIGFIKVNQDVVNDGLGMVAMNDALENSARHLFDV